MYRVNQVRKYIICPWTVEQLVGEEWVLHRAFPRQELAEAFVNALNSREAPTELLA